MNLKLNPESTQPLYAHPFQQKLRLLCKPSGLRKEYLIVNSKTGDIESTHLAKALFGKIKEAFYLRNWGNSKLVQVKVLNFLENGQHLINSKEDHKCAQELARRAGKEAARLFNSPSFQQKKASREFFELHQHELEPYRKFLTFPNEDTSLQKNKGCNLQNSTRESKQIWKTRIFLISAAGLGILIGLGLVFALKNSSNITSITNQESSSAPSPTNSKEPNSPPSSSTPSSFTAEQKGEIPKEQFFAEPSKKDDLIWNKASDYTFPALAAITTLGSILAVGGCLLANKKTNLADTKFKGISLLDKINEKKKNPIKKLI